MKDLITGEDLVKASLFDAYLDAISKAAEVLSAAALRYSDPMLEGCAASLRTMVKAASMLNREPERPIRYPLPVYMD